MTVAGITERLHVVVESLEEDPRLGRIALVRDSYGNSRSINANLLSGGGTIPQPGEAWIIERVNSTWVFTTLLVPQRPVLTSTVESGTPARSLIDALAALGLVVDQTTTVPAGPVGTALTVSDSASIDLTLTGDPVSGYTLSAKSALTGIGALADLNTYTTTGTFIQVSDAQALGGSNYPIGYAGVLEVVASMTGWCYQRYTTYTHAGTGNKVYARSLYSGVWCAWESVSPVPMTAPGMTLTGNPTSGYAVQMPSGSIIDFGGSAAPSGWLLCDGSAISRTTYAALFAVIGTTFGAGDGSTTFNVPNFSGRTSVGVGDSGTAGHTSHARGTAGGEETHLLTAAESGLPSHNHTQNPHTHTQTLGSPITTVAPAAGAGVIGQNNTSLVSSTTATNNANTAADATASHNNMPPFLTVNKIIKF